MSRHGSPLFVEAFSSIIWASAGALAVVNFGFAIVPSTPALAVLAGAWMLGPKSP
jgi:hypothetical protein